MQIQITFRPIYRVTPRGFLLERRDYVSPELLLRKISDYQCEGGYTLHILSQSESAAKILLQTYDDAASGKFIGELIVSCHNAFIFEIRTL